MDRIYMDHSATTPLTEHALQALLPYLREEFGNPSAVYSYGQAGKNALEKCRNRVARCLGALPTEIYFTSGGTESNNWVLRSVAEMKQATGRHIISTAIEHNSVLKPLEALEKHGYEVTYLRPDHLGRVSPEQLEAAIRPDTILISVMLANNVVGTLQDVASLAAVARRHRILFHTDAVQAVGHVPINVRRLGVDLLSVSAHKFGGPKGVGVLFCRLPNRLEPLLYGGGQEKEERSGTENVPGIVGMTVALEDSVAAIPQHTEYLKGLGLRLAEGILSIPGVHLTGDPEHRLPGFCSFLIEGIPHSVLLVNRLNESGLCASSGSACSASSKEASHVITALGYDEQLAAASLRITPGPENTPEEVETAIGIVRIAIESLRAEQKTRAPRLEGRVNEPGAPSPLD